MYGRSECKDKGPNAAIRWAKWDETNDKWLKASLDEVKEWTEEGHRGLSMEVFALQDIRPGEEVSIEEKQHFFVDNFY